MIFCLRATLPTPGVHVHVYVHIYMCIYIYVYVCVYIFGELGHRVLMFREHSAY